VVSVEQQASHRISQLEHRFQTLFQSSPASLSLQTWPEGRFLKVNTAFTVAVGLPSVEILGKTSAELGLYLEMSDREKIFEKLQKDGVVENCEVHFRRRNGGEAWSMATVQLTDCDGERCLLSAAVDITDLKLAQQEEQRLREQLLQQEAEARKQAEQFRQQSDARWASLTESSPEFILVVNRERRIEWINRTQPDLTREQVIGQPVINFIPRNAQAEPEDVIEHVFRTGQPHTHEVQARGEGGRICWFLSRVGPIFDEGEVTGLIVIASDITEQKEAEERDRFLREQLARMNRVYLETAASAMIVHEVSNRLAGLRNRTSTCLNHADRNAKDVPENVLKGIRKMREDFQGLTEFLNHQRKFLEQGALTFADVSTEVLMNDAARFVGEQALDARAAVIVHPPDTAKEIVCDAIQIQQVLMNLLLNAISAMKKLPEGQQRQVELSVEPAGEGLLSFRVSDTGPGWPPGFDLNQKMLRKSTTDGGLGLGLEISRMIVEAHKGRMEAIPATSGGATVQVILPVSQERGSLDDD
ncbi:MAG: PAS domain S-box protein, partial [Planctomycetaceae bacterium]|nr:PAS domain S-box protein [Planctomycetaceae bacterium]